jgi:predicted amidohydrolase
VPKDPAFVGLCDQWETYLNRYKELAKECGICIQPGTIVESHPQEESEENKLLNVAYFIDHEGKVVGKYVKKNLWYDFASLRHFAFKASVRTMDTEDTTGIPNVNTSQAAGETSMRSSTRPSGRWVC